ncbi:hypothetical protein NDU88_000646 [Pleurodeles waltl]|uniref:Uncharacterized protein n=1 Tax=Pleurodeles waltl TaxID=8319 RepID=A0AAV7ML48_PLEWA|nr:hypothetical protein NDU88_000646 [Pleurodeles waltl]
MLYGEFHHGFLKAMEEKSYTNFSRQVVAVPRAHRTQDSGIETNLWREAFFQREPRHRRTEGAILHRGLQCGLFVSRSAA